MTSTSQPPRKGNGGGWGKSNSKGNPIDPRRPSSVCCHRLSTAEIICCVSVSTATSVSTTVHSCQSKPGCPCRLPQAKHTLPSQTHYRAAGGQKPDRDQFSLTSIHWNPLHAKDASVSTTGPGLSSADFLLLPPLSRLEWQVGSIYADACNLIVVRKYSRAPPSVLDSLQTDHMMPCKWCSFHCLPVHHTFSTLRYLGKKLFIAWIYRIVKVCFVMVSD